MDVAFRLRRVSRSCSGPPAQARRLSSIALPDWPGRIAGASLSVIESCSIPPGMNLPVAERHVGYVFQNLALFPHMTAEQNVRYGLKHLPSNERARTAAILQAFRIAHLAAQSARHLRREKASASRWLEPWSPIRSFCFWMNRWPRSTRPPSTDHRRSPAMESHASYSDTLRHA